MAGSLGYTETPLRVRETGARGGEVGGGRGAMRFSVFTESAIDELGESSTLGIGDMKRGKLMGLGN